MCDCWHCPQGVRSSGGSGVCCDCWHCPQGVRSSGGSGVLEVCDLCVTVGTVLRVSGVVVGLVC